MNLSSNPYQEWVGRTETIADVIALAPAQGAAAMLDDVATVLEDGAPLPPLWHWFYFLPKAPQAELGIDGHPARGGFMPPIPLPRRMFAGARLTFHRPLSLGAPAQRTATITAVSEKSGKSGQLAFVTVHYAFAQAGTLCIEEEQDIVYRGGNGAKVPPPMPAAWPEIASEAWSRIVVPDPRLLFRFSALTFNAHRIHYDRPYAMDAEGYPGLVVQGPLTAVLLMEMARRHTTRRIAAYGFRGQSPLFDLAPFRLVGRPEGDRVELEAQGPDGRTAMNAFAVLG